MCRCFGGEDCGGCEKDWREAEAVEVLAFRRAGVWICAWAGVLFIDPPPPFFFLLVIEPLWVRLLGCRVLNSLNRRTRWLFGILLFWFLTRGSMTV